MTNGIHSSTQSSVSNANRNTKIRHLNDAFRKTFIGGKVLVTRGIADRSDLLIILSKVREFDAFDHTNDPYGEHDFGAIQIGDDQIFWKIDYYSAGDMECGSPDPSDPALTCRALTIMLGEEY